MEESHVPEPSVSHTLLLTLPWQRVSPLATSNSKADLEIC